MKLAIPAEDKFWVACRLIDHRSSVSWACDCAERVLSIFEKKYPENKRPRKAIKITRAWLAGKATLEKVRVAANAAYATAYDAFDADAFAVYAGSPAQAANAAYCAAFAASNAAYAASAATAAAHADYAASAAERAWQIKRMMEYIRGERVASSVS